MAQPLDAVTAIHNAFRADIAGIDAAALDSARGKPGLAPTVERFRFLSKVLVWHAQGEELAIFPALEAVAPSVAEAYERDHRGLDAAFDALSAAVSARDALGTSSHMLVDLWYNGSRAAVLRLDPRLGPAPASYS